MTHVLYYMDLSYYSGKLQSYLRYKRIPHRLQHVDWWMMANEILPATGMMEVPVMRLSDGTWLRDTTSIIDRLETAYPERPVLPEDPYQRFFLRVVEDYADEWLWRPAMHFRWSYAKDRRLYERRFVEDFMPHPRGTRALTKAFLGWRQKREYVDHDGVGPQTLAHVEAQYTRTLAFMEDALQDRAFLFDDRPSFADFGFMASMFRHFSVDPTPARIMREQAPRTYAWVARMWGAGDFEPGDWTVSPGTLPPGWGALLSQIGRTYFPYLEANAAALSRGAATFDVSIEGITYRNLPTNRYRVWCLERLIGALRALPENAVTPVQLTLERHGMLTALTPEAPVHASLRDGDKLPECTPFPIGRAAKLRYYVTGTPRHEAPGD